MFWRSEVDSNFALIKKDVHYIDLAGTYRFAGGTIIEGGGLLIGDGGTLRSDVEVQPNAWLSVVGKQIGDVKTLASADGYGTLYIHGTVNGNVLNAGDTSIAMHLLPSTDPSRPGNRIEGNFRQVSTGTLEFALPYQDYFVPLTITGRADLAGTLLLYQYDDWDAGLFPLPSSPVSTRLLHADGGVFGTFDRWTSPGLFIEGSLRYQPNDVWFDLARASVQGASAAAGITSPVTLAAAGNLDRALASADGFASMPRAQLGTAHQQLLNSTARILYQQDWAQATRTLDSLAGQEQAMLGSHLRDFNASAADRIGAQTTLRTFSRELKAWSTSLDGGRADGMDQWLSPRLLLGGSVAQRSDTDGLVFGSSRHLDDLASLYLHYRGERWQATGMLAGARSLARSQRRIDLDDGRVHRVQGQRDLGLLGLHGEFSRPMTVAGGTFQPFAALDYGYLRSKAFQEFGDTGFELLGPDARLQQLDGAMGMRYLRQWRLGNGWLNLHASLQREQPLANAGLLPVAFTGAPEAMFDLRDWTWPGSSTSATLSLQADAGDGWRWSLQGEHGHRDRSRNGWQLALVRGL